MTITMRFEGVVSNPFAAILRGSLLDDLRKVEENWARRLRARVEVYPAQRGGQVYQRTYQFRDAWTVAGPNLVNGDLICDLTNDTPYSIYVVGDDVGNMQNQAYHAGRWYLFRKLVEDSERQFVAEAQAVVNHALAPATIRP